VVISFGRTEIWAKPAQINQETYLYGAHVHMVPYNESFFINKSFYHFDDIGELVKE
jgi:hypothetical protein